MKPSPSARNFTPSSTPFASSESTIVGTTVAGQIVQGQLAGADAAVVNELVKSAAMTSPAVSVTCGPVVPPWTTTVSPDDPARKRAGSKGAVHDAAS